MIKVLVFLLLSVAPASLPGSVWLMPWKFSVAVGDKALVTVRAGNDLTGEPLDVKRESVEKAEHHDLAGVTDMRPLLKDGTKNQLEEVLSREGTHLLALKSVSEPVSMPAEEFNVFLKDHALDDIFAQREKTGTLNAEGKQLYSWSSKLLLQAGNKKDDTAIKSVGFPLEIVPERNPYMAKAGDRMRFKIFWQGKPLFGAKVRVWSNKERVTSVQTIYTGKDGVIETQLSNDGTWMVSVVKIIPAKSDKADWRTYQASLVFGW
ncbi:MAG TPA: DUF4198 domain-containing protein [Ohtaekwangia sp.]|nr:DUF4198 domain-containing protein [Ohtaekwangia sp.]